MFQGIKWSNAIEVSEGKEREREKIFEEPMAEKLSNLIRNIHPRIQEM